MKLIEFPDQTVVIAKDQPEYLPLPAFQFANDPTGRTVCCWQLTWRERLRLLLTGRLWHQIMTFRQPLQPQWLGLDKPFNPGDVIAARAARINAEVKSDFVKYLLKKYGERARARMKHFDALNYHPNDRRRSIELTAEDFRRCRELGVMFIEGARIVDAAKNSAVPE